MGAWGTAAFDNDDASDWVYELEKDGIAAVDAALKEALGPQELETPTDVNAIAAGEVIAAALGRPVDGLRDEDIARTRERARAQHHARARRACPNRRRTRPRGSEIAELWAETEDDDEWRGLVEDLIRRLSPDAGPRPRRVVTRPRAD